MSNYFDHLFVFVLVTSVVVHCDPGARFTKYLTRHL